MKTTVLLEEGNIKAFESSLKPEMEKAQTHFEKDILSLRTGRAQPALVEGVMVECYGNQMRLKELASIAAPASNMITIQPWDKTVVSHIEKAIMNSHLGVTPQTDGDMIRIELPRMSSERRGELVKELNKKTESARVHIRNIRRDAQNEIRDAVKNKAVSEDFEKRLAKSLQDITDSFIKKVEEQAAKKEKDITTI